METHMIHSAPPELPLVGSSGKAGRASQFGKLPQEIKNVLLRVAPHPRTFIVRYLYDYAALCSVASTQEQWLGYGLAAGRIGGALERDEITPAQACLLEDYLRHLPLSATKP